MAPASATATGMGADETLLLMDLVDTMRSRSADADLAPGGAGRAAEVERIRGFYAAQGLDVPASTVERAMDEMAEARFAHEPMPAGRDRTLALAYVRRGRVAAVAAGLAAAVCVPVLAWQLVVAGPAARAESDRVRQVSVTIPAALEGALASARSAAAGDPASIGDIEAIAASARQALERGDAADAQKSVEAVRKAGQVAAARAERTRRMDEAETLVRGASAAATEPDASRAVAAAARDLRSAASTDDPSRYAAAKAGFEALSAWVSADVDVRIVDREGTRSGVWREWTAPSPGTAPRPAPVRYHYLVVEAEDAAGKPVARPVRDAETGRDSVASTWAVRVPEEVYQAVGRDKSSDGALDGRSAGGRPSSDLGVRNGRDVGRKPPGKLDISWSVRTGGETIAKWD